MGYRLWRNVLPKRSLRDLVAIGERVHAAWMSCHREQVRAHRLFNSSGLMEKRWYADPHARTRMFELLTAPEVVRRVEHTFGGGLHLHGTQLFFNPLDREQQPVWHRDLQYMGMSEAEQRALLPELVHLHVRLPLRAERGFMLVPQSHARWDTELERAVRLQLQGHCSYEPLPGEHAFDLLPGEMLVFSAHMLHRATYVGNEDRLSFDVMVGRPHPRVPLTPRLQELPPEEAREAEWIRRARALSQGARGRRLTAGAARADSDDDVDTEPADRD